MISSSGDKLRLDFHETRQFQQVNISTEITFNIGRGHFDLFFGHFFLFDIFRLDEMIEQTSIGTKTIVETDRVSILCLLAMFVVVVVIATRITEILSENIFLSDVLS